MTVDRRSLMAASAFGSAASYVSLVAMKATPPSHDSGGLGESVGRLDRGGERLDLGPCARGVVDHHERRRCP